MCSKGDLIVFLAGAQTFHTLSHILLSFTETLPIKVFSITWTQQLNIVAIVINGLVTAALLWWASRVR